MAGKELYIEPILDANLSVVPGLSDNIAEMTAQLNETTRILTNVLANQGLEAHQEAYNSSAFAALTLKHSWRVFDASITGMLYINGTSFNVSKPDSVGINNGFSKVDSETKTVQVENAVNTGGIFDDHYYVGEKVKAKAWCTANGSQYIEANISFKDDTQTGTLTSTTTTSGNAFCEITIPEEHRGKEVAFAQYKVYFSGGSTISDKNMVFSNLTYSDTEGNDKAFVNKRIKRVTFNSVNALTFYAEPTSSNITAEVLDVIIPNTVFVTLPDIATVGTWAVFLTNGNIEGVNLALVDNTTHELVALLPAATSDISSVTQTSNLALSVSMTAETQVIRSIAQRYY